MRIMSSIRWRFVFAALLAVIPPLYLFGRYGVEVFDKFTCKAQEEEMITQAFMLGEHYKEMVLKANKKDFRKRSQDFEKVMSRYGELIQSRLQILSPRGIVLFDSDPDSLVGADFSDRKEIVNVMAGNKYKAAWHLNKELNRVYYFVPIPIIQDGELVAIAYVSHHTGQISKAILKIKEHRKIISLSVLLLAVIISVFIAQTMTSRLRKLTKAARSYAKGGDSLALEVGGSDEIGELGHAMRIMAEDIEKRNAYNRDFVSTVMHELRTPVTAIKGAAEVLEQGAMERKDMRLKFLSNIKYEADRLNRMVGEISELTKLDVEILRGKREKIDYCGVVKEIVDRLMPTFDQQKASFFLRIPEEKIEVLMIIGRIEQVISNLLENAFRYTPVDGNVELKVVYKKDDNQVVTVVSDTGCGISDKHFPFIFNKFYTTEPKDLPKDYGSGLGLAIAKSIVENHGGRIWVESAEGQGARFSFSLPVCRA